LDPIYFFTGTFFEELTMKIINALRRTPANNVFVALLVSAVIGLTACKEEGPAEKAGKRVDQAVEKTNEGIEKQSEAIKENIEQRDEAMGRKSETVGEYMDDATITSKVKAEMMADPLIGENDIEVVTDKGVVKLTGTVKSQQTADRAVEIANGIKGVQSVENHLLVKAEP
jgi:hyperosmotically inducible protein